MLPAAIGRILLFSQPCESRLSSCPHDAAISPVSHSQLTKRHDCISSRNLKRRHQFLWEMSEAEQVPENNAEGFPGLDLNSGWN